MKTWDWKKTAEPDYPDSRASFDSGEEADDVRMSFDDDEIDKPIARVLQVYQKATPIMKSLFQDPTNEELQQQLYKLNEMIGSDNRNEQLPEDTWKIRIGFFAPHYKIIRDYYNRLKKNPADTDANHAFVTEEKLIHDMIEKHHFPPEWSISRMQQKSIVADKTAEETSLFVESDDSAETKTIDYPWPTLETADGSRILGVRSRGKVGLQVCVETSKDGRVVRRLVPESAVHEVQQYIEINGYKNLAEGQSTWTSRQRGDFEELLWVTDPAPPRSGKRDPPADCCVRFREQGLQILTRTSLFKVLGEKRAKAEMESVCVRDGTSAPWKMQPREQSTIKQEDTKVDLHRIPKQGGYS